MEFPEGWGGGGGFNEKPSVGGVWIFSGTTHCESRKKIIEIKLFKLFSEHVFKFNFSPSATAYHFECTFMEGSTEGQLINMREEKKCY